jgi:hypothetical protein
MIANYDSTCAGCGDPITKGDAIHWSRDGGARCLTCGPTQPDERRGPATAAEDETGWQRTMRQRIEALEADLRAERTARRALHEWCVAVARDLNITYPPGGNP